MGRIAYVATAGWGLFAGAVIGEEAGGSGARVKSAIKSCSVALVIFSPYPIQFLGKTRSVGIPETRNHCLSVQAWRQRRASHLSTKVTLMNVKLRPRRIGHTGFAFVLFWRNGQCCSFILTKAFS